MAEEEFPSARVTEEVTIFWGHLESFLSENWHEWGTACKDIEDFIGIPLEKNQLVYRRATLKAKGTVPEMLQQILNKTEGK